MGARVRAPTAGTEPAAATASSPLPAGGPACCTPPSGCAAAPLSAIAASVTLLLPVVLLAGVVVGRAANEPLTPGLGRAGREKSGCQKPSRAYVLAFSTPCCLQRQFEGRAKGVG